MVAGTVLEERLLIPTIQEGKPFYNESIEQALKDLKNAGFEPVYMPELVGARTVASKDSVLWRNWWTALSVRATGRTKGGSAVVVYAHVPNFFSEPDNIEKAKKRGLVRYAGIMPQQEFQRLVDLADDERVFVIDHDALRRSESSIVSVERALEHPQTIPFLGGRARAEAYLGKYREIYGDWIGILHSDDLAAEPLGRLLFLGVSVDNLDGNSSLNYDGRFVGVRAGGAAPRKTPTATQIKSVLENYLAPELSGAAAERIARLNS